MKNILLVVVVVFFISACQSGDGKKVRVKSEEEVLESYANGTPRIVRTFDEADGKRQYTFEKEYFEDGNLNKEGAIKDGHRHGEWKGYYRDGNLKNTGYFKNGKRNDTTIAYYENGNVKYVGIFNNGEKTGIWKVFSEEGELTDTQVYINPGEIRTDSISIKN